ncbi:Asp-tRNA(Asn)/Glu-tRNA(Gln) amidotransferase subunit GatB [Pontiella sulfatireligans]|uniref:Aspartyl/glutamyl-tRNA(Asn/Gln) amidotransferase subunit B n=1 Tax=Pontiella sulfatireligans TaxID=2750658 RepID=A0A6C2UJQ6_9BACT|nr:Asp-tRNA(Asn)/Glu-tRNA(Gln) amidotransferase subunit GatB [Pontiella sulfatireligans]VGO20113.1 Aspartyl/glutamyl-tRNA(Asn/Gln) amidotransferase subunit B [Pontiella sulfatireligans]
MKYEATIGLETHVMQKTNTKMFCSCKCEYGAEPNIHVCPVCLGYPGALPVMNEKAIELCCKAGMLLGCEINPYSKWDRKNYFYPDMAKNYQITQADEPLCLGGQVTVEVEGEMKTFTLERIHQEENAAKNTHIAGASLVDYNRAGTALMEIVSNPCMSSAADALAYMAAVKQIMQYGGISNCDQEKGQMRSDVNVSVRPVGQKELGSKVEIKNMNSFAFIKEAIEYEIDRQTALIESGGSVVQETRGYDPDRGETFTQRTKENAHDYRYFPEPDLMPVKVAAEQLEQWRSELPEMPAPRRDRYVAELGLPEYDAGVLTADKATADWFERAMLHTKNAKAVSNFIMGEMMRLLSEQDMIISESKVTPEKLAEIIALIDAKTISTGAGKQVFEAIFNEGGEPKAIIEAKGLAQVSDDSALDGWADEAIANNPKPVEEYKAGNAASINFLMGQVMKASRGKANPGAVMQMLKQKLDA